MSRERRHPGAWAFTLIEIIAALLVIGLSIATVAPLVVAMTDTTDRGLDRAEARYALHLALDRIVRFVREIPESSAGGSPAITSFNAQSLILDNGARVSLSGSTISFTDATGGSAPLCADVETFAMVFLQEDGVSVATVPANVQRIQIAIERNGLRLATLAHLRIAEATQ